MIKLKLFYHVLSRAGHDVKEEELTKYIYVYLDAKNSLIIILFMVMKLVKMIVMGI